MQKDLADLTLADFSPLVGQEFHVQHEGQTLSLKLVQAQALRSSGRERRTPFHLHFHGPTIPPLSQGTYHYTHSQLGTYEIFSVPLGQTPEHRLYEAIFS